MVTLEITYQETILAIFDLVEAGTLRGGAASNVGDLLETLYVALKAARAGVDGPDGLGLLNAANQALILLTARVRAEEAQ